jgi:hypothetical protein
MNTLVWIPKLVSINAGLLVLASIVAWARFGPYSF